MSDMYITKGKLPGVIERLMGRYRVFAPVKKGRYHQFARLTGAAEADLAFRNTRLSPKGLLHPQAERMFEYSLAKDDPERGIVKESPKDYSPGVILGIRPCDAKAFQLDDANFDTQTVKDTWWVRRREALTLVGLACNTPCSTCFCTSVGSGPFETAGLDALLVDTGEGYVAKALTEKGKKAVDASDGWDPAPADSRGKIDAATKAAAQSIGPSFDPETLARQDMLELYNSPLWEEVQFSCINCGTCTFVCPTCWCFDIQDEVNGDQGDRMRLWDSCMFPLFTLHGSGHNPRAVKTQRVRQRFMHKLKYYQDKYHCGAACVGCGRCVQACPVNIDIRQVGRLMASPSCVCPA
ncbi:MAG: 4Fe-4S dicluster domain-containing protein [Desulfobacteraceae bacterium]|nr:4Fe-4S dicluster domain-containing protein [Desulfobacteraceae bacterium]